MCFFGGSPAKTSQVVNLSTRNGFNAPTRPWVYQGISFKTASDKAKDESGQTGQTPSEHFSSTRISEKFQTGLSGLTTPDQASCWRCGRELVWTDEQRSGVCNWCDPQANLYKDEAVS
jgi:hypothetical protein